MKTNVPSRTAQYMALFRAIETERSASERIFTDPYAISFLDNGLKFISRLSALPFARGLIQKYIHRRIPGAYSSGVARTKYIDELLKRSLDNGVKQVIILGAGFDTRASRLDFMNSVPVIEIDHPDTARLKMDTLEKTFGKLPENVKYYQIDFNLQSLDDFAAQHQIDLSIPTTIIWEGVTNYLNAEAINATFRFVQRFPAGSYVIFTYVNQLLLDNPKSFYGGEKLLQDVAAIGEKWTFGLMPETVPDFLRNFGLTLVEDLGAADYRAQYLPGYIERGYEFYRVAFARKG